MQTSTYTVQSGDTLWYIAADHHISLGELISANQQIANPDQIDVGQIIHLPVHRAPSRLHRHLTHAETHQQHHHMAAFAGGGHGFGVHKGGGQTDKPAVHRPHVDPKEKPKPRPGHHPDASLPRWFRIAQDEMHHYIPGREAFYVHDSGVGSYGLDWCSVFANWVMQKAGYSGTRNAMAASWMKWGIPLKHPRRGAIVVFDDGVMNDPQYPNNPYFHVGLVDGGTADHLICLGGNQGHAVKLSDFRRNYGGPVKGFPQRFHYRWPSR